VPVAELKDRLRADLTAAIKARDALRSSTLRMALTAVTTAEVSGKQARELSDDEVTAVLVSQSKRRREAADAFDQAGRDELAAKERAEAAVLGRLKPQVAGRADGAVVAAEVRRQVSA